MSANVKICKEHAGKHARCVPTREGCGPTVISAGLLAWRTYHRVADPIGYHAINVQPVKDAESLDRQLAARRAAYEAAEALAHPDRPAPRKKFGGFLARLFGGK